MVEIVTKKYPTVFRYLTTLSVHQPYLEIAMPAIGKTKNYRYGVAMLCVACFLDQLQLPKVWSTYLEHPVVSRLKSWYAWALMGNATIQQNFRLVQMCSIKKTWWVLWWKSGGRLLIGKVLLELSGNTLRITNAAAILDYWYSEGEPVVLQYTQLAFKFQFRLSFRLMVLNLVVCGCTVKKMWTLEITKSEQICTQMVFWACKLLT